MAETNTIEAEIIKFLFQLPTEEKNIVLQLTKDLVFIESVKNETDSGKRPAVSG